MASGAAGRTRGRGGGLGMAMRASGGSKDQRRPIPTREVPVKGQNPRSPHSCPDSHLLSPGARAGLRIPPASRSRTRDETRDPAGRHRLLSASTHARTHAS
eukprot:scaffold7583_cov578-Prasinococcus_capsulatus_cf.AAC.1